MNSLKEEFEIVVELNPKASEKQVDHLKEDLAAEPGVLKESVTYISKEEGLQSLSTELGAQLMDIEMPNPLTDVVLFRMDAGAFSMERVSEIKEKFSQGRPEILEIYYQEGMVEGVLANLDRISWVFLGAGLLLASLALMLIYNAIRLSIYANRFLIRNMELVGASWSFIRRPFLSKSLKHGLVSALVAIIGLVLTYYLAADRLPEITQYFSYEYILYLVAVLVVSGMLINFISTWIVVTRFLKMQTNDLHL
ncbi:MAG: permease-like cell division protein FtsX [Saprospiraceae bacterium]|nr:permease-like cell division protein FtsX [Saprospiraceae bacterium]